MRFWLDKGLDGFRCDAVPYLFEREGTNCENLPETHEFLRELRRAASTRSTAGASSWPRPTSGPPTSGPISATGDEFHMAFHFPLMPRIFMAVRSGGPAARSRTSSCHTPEIPADLPVVPLPPQPRRADARDGDRRGAATHVPRLCAGPAHAAQPRHPAAPGAAARQRPAPDRAAQRACCSRCPAARSSTTATRSAWATTSTSATATACGRRCSGRATAMPASPAPTPRGSTCR